MITTLVKIIPAITLLFELYNSRLPRALNNPCGLIKMLNVNEVVMLVDNKLKILQRQSILEIQNMWFIPAFLLRNIRTTLLFQNASLTFLNNARFVSNAELMYYLLQNVRSAFCLS